jgi:hypothetical protein
LLAYYQAQELFSDFDAKVEIIFLAWDGNLFECSDFMKFFNEDGSITKLLKDKEIADKKERDDFLKEPSEDLAALGQGQSPPTPFDVVEAEQLKKPPHDADAYADAYADAAKIQQNVNELPQEEAPPATMLGDDLYNKHEEKIPSRDVLANDETIKTYREQILSKLDQFTTTELDKDKICELFLISCNGSNLEQFKKLLFFREIFASEYCVMSNPKDCHTIYMKLSNEIEKLQLSLYPPAGGSKSRRTHRRKPARKTTRKYKSKSKSKSKPKTHRRRRAHHSRVRKHKKYTSRRR